MVYKNIVRLFKNYYFTAVCSLGTAKLCGPEGAGQCLSCSRSCGADLEARRALPSPEHSALLGGEGWWESPKDRWAERVGPSAGGPGWSSSRRRDARGGWFSDTCACVLFK